MEDSELTAYQVRDGQRWVPMPRCSLCGDIVPFMHEHLVADHGYASPGSVFGRLVVSPSTGELCCADCGYEPYEDESICRVCRLTFTNRRST